MYQDAALKSLLPGDRDSTEQFRSTVFQRWEDRASVRRKPHRRLTEPHDGPYFSPELHAVCAHPLVTARGPKAQRFLLVRRLYDYLHFTTELETLAVIPVATALSRGRAGLPISKRMRADAFKIVTDEAWHAQFSYDLAENVSAATGIEMPERTRTPAFVRRLDEVRERVPDHLIGVEALLFAIVSETLISGLLSDLPHDNRLPKAVRDLVRDHAEDEGRHHAYFRTVLRATWAVLTPRERDDLSPLLPDVIYAFLEPDYQETVDALSAIGLSVIEIEQVIREAWPEDLVSREIALASSPLLRYLEDLGALDSNRTIEAFEASGLWTPDRARDRPPCRTP